MTSAQIIDAFFTSEPLEYFEIWEASNVSYEQVLTVCGENMADEYAHWIYREQK